MIDCFLKTLRTNKERVRTYQNFVISILLWVHERWLLSLADAPRNFNVNLKAGHALFRIQMIHEVVLQNISWEVV